MNNHLPPYIRIMPAGFDAFWDGFKEQNPIEALSFQLNGQQLKGMLMDCYRKGRHDREMEYQAQLESDREAQRQSFAFGNAHLDNPDVTREMVAEQAEKLKFDSGSRIKKLPKYCNQEDCHSLAVYEYEWAGEICHSCERHSVGMCNIGEAMGMKVNLRPITQ